MSDADLYVSNGSCYYGEGQISDPRFIPCGNAALSGPQSCCYQGDFCLSTNVCYDNDTSVTYISGCTDGTFSSSKCPHKSGYPDQQWVALARCDGDDIDLFSGCGKHKDEIQIKHEDCTCNAASALISNPASGQPTLNQIGLLPTTAGGTISFNPTTLPTAIASESESGSGGLSTSAQVGIGVGVGVGVPIIVVSILLFWFVHRKKKTKKQQGPQSEILPGGPQQGTHNRSVPMQHSPPPVYSSDLQNTQPGWLGYKPELHGESTDRSELPIDTPGTKNMNSIQNTPLENYRPSELASERTDGLCGASSVPFISPQSTGSTDKPQPGSGGHVRTGSNMDPISEHHIDKSFNPM